MSGLYPYPQFPFSGHYRLDTLLSPKTYTILNKSPKLPLPVLTAEGFKEYLNIINVADTTFDNRINSILASVIAYIESKGNYSFYNTQYLASFSADCFLNMEITKKLIGVIDSIEYKGKDFDKTQALSLIPNTFVYEGNNLNTFEVIEQGNRRPIIKFNQHYERPALYREEDNILVTFTVSPFSPLPYDLENAMYQHAVSIWNGCEEIPQNVLNIYDTYISASGTSNTSGGIYII